MVKSWATGCLLALSALSTARAVCDDLDMFLDVPSPLTKDTTISLNVGVIECELIETDDIEELTTIVVEGGTLTIASDNTVQFINVAFLVMPGAALVFDMPETLFGPIDAVPDTDFQQGSMLEVSDGGSLTFNGDVTFREVDSVANLLEVFGSAEFKKTFLAEDNPGGIRVPSGELRFRGDATFRGNDFVNIINSEGGFVRFSTTATFDASSSSDGRGGGCVISNDDSTSRMSFRGDVYVINNTRCTNSEGPPVFNEGVMNFYGKARFNDNRAGGDGGAVQNRSGSMTFRSAVQFNNNFSEFDGGGLAVSGGEVTFRRGVTFSGNTADGSGGAFAVLVGEVVQTFGSLTFENPSVVRFRDNAVDTTMENENDCTVGEVEEGTTLIGFPGDDVCVQAT